MKGLRLVLVDDHEVVRLGMRLALEDSPDIQVVGEAARADDAVTLCQNLQPDVVIMDIRMPGRGGIDACREIASRWPRIKVIMLSSYSDDNLILDAIQAGAVGYLLKGGGTDELLRALDAVRHGNALLDPDVTKRVLTMMKKADSRGNPFAELTRRELVVLYLLSLGKTNHSIAEQLGLSEKTVRNHISTILSKLACGNRVEAATYALQNRIRNYLPEGVTLPD